MLQNELLNRLFPQYLGEEISICEKHNCEQLKEMMESLKLIYTRNLKLLNLK
jgi:hypothetical protein